MCVSERVHVGGCILGEKEELGLIAFFLIDAGKQLPRKKTSAIFGPREKKSKNRKKWFERTGNKNRNNVAEDPEMVDNRRCLHVHRERDLHGLHHRLEPQERGSQEV